MNGSVPDFSKLSTDAVFASFDAVMNELQRRRVVRSSNNPVADYAELVVADSFGVSPERGSTLGYDVKAGRKKIQVKARRESRGKVPTHYGWIRNLDGNEFNFVACVLFRSDFTVAEADLLNLSSVRRFIGPRNERVGAQRLPRITDEMRAHPGVTRLSLTIPPNTVWPCSHERS
jgi:hypothetical protein